MADSVILPESRFQLHHWQRAQNRR